MPQQSTSAFAGSSSARLTDTKINNASGNITQKKGDKVNVTVNFGMNGSPESLNGWQQDTKKHIPESPDSPYLSAFPGFGNLAIDFARVTLTSATTAFEKSKNKLMHFPHLYTRHMFKDQPHGYPLYRPEPDKSLSLDQRRKGVRVGDVGLMTQDGSFDVLFNVWKKYQDSNTQGVPEDFTPVDVEQAIYEFFSSNTHLFSKTVTPIYERAPNVYGCSGVAGAILELPQGATFYEARNQGTFQQLAADHAENWYKYVLSKRGRDAPNGSLFIVTGCIKTNFWGIAVFDERQKSDGHLQFTSDDNVTGGRGAQEMYDWKKLGPVSATTDIGPRAKDLVVKDEDEENQCVFLRGYSITLKDGAWAALKKRGFRRWIMGKLQSMVQN